MAGAIIFALRQADTGTVVAEVCRKMGISEATAPAARLLQLDRIAEAKRSMAVWAFPSFGDSANLKKRTSN